MEAICILVFSELENNSDLWKIEWRPFPQVFKDGVGIESRRISKHYEPKNPSLQQNWVCLPSLINI